jgi:hypothetical protein
VVESKARNIKSGVLSSTLFNFFVADFPDQTFIKANYADDFNIADTSPDLPTLAAALTDDLVHVSEWADKNNLKLAPEKCVVTLFTPWLRQLNHQPQVTLNGSLLPLDKNPRYLGLIADPLFTSNKHGDSTKIKASKAYQVMKASPGTSWGKNKETFLATYKMLVRPVLEYLAPIWFPNASASTIQKMQAVQNKCLCLAIGCHQKSSIDHLHQETKILKLKKHLQLLCSQFLVETLSPSHCSNALVNPDSGPRKMRHTLYTKCIDSVRRHVNAEGFILEINQKKVISSLHTAAVASAISELAPIKVLGRRLPDIGEIMNSLPRAHQTVLSQLRSDYCIKLRSYLFSIGKVQDSLYPECALVPHTTAHLLTVLVIQPT